MHRNLSVIFTLVTAGVLFGATSGTTAAASPRPAVRPTAARPVAQIFATNNTAIITNPRDPRLRTRLIAFAREVRGIIRTHGSVPGRSTLLNGVFWSSELKKSTYERSREFDVGHVHPAGLRAIAHVIDKRFHQESVLTFQFLPRRSAHTNGVEVTVPGLSAQRLDAGLLKDPAFEAELGGGSVTVGGTLILILIAPTKDLGLVHTFVTKIGGNWSRATVQYGDEEFVS